MGRNESDAERTGATENTASCEVCRRELAVSELRRTEGMYFCRDAEGCDAVSIPSTLVERTKRIMARVERECRTDGEELVEQHARYEAARQAIVTSVQEMLLEHGSKDFDLDKHIENLAVLALTEQTERLALKALLQKKE